MNVEHAIGWMTPISLTLRSSELGDLTRLLNEGRAAYVSNLVSIKTDVWLATVQTKAEEKWCVLRNWERRHV